MKHKAGRKNREIPVDVTDTNIFDSANILERNIQKKNGQWWINQLLQPHPIKTTSRYPRASHGAPSWKYSALYDYRWKQ